MRSIVSIVVGLAMIQACSNDPAGPEREGTFALLALAGGIAIANEGAEARFFILFEGETAAVVDLNFDPDAEEHWIRIPAGESRLVPWSAIHGFHAGARTVVVHSWIRSVAHEIDGGIQWGAEGFLTRFIEL